MLLCAREKLFRIKSAISNRQPVRLNDLVGQARMNRSNGMAKTNYSITATLNHCNTKKADLAVSLFCLVKYVY
jgi:hypothetical protein